MVKEKSLLYWKNNKTKREPLAPLNKKGGKTMKQVLTVMAFIVSFFLCLMPSQVFAWYTHCVNNACSASNGGIEVQWQQIHPSKTYIGVLTGVKGLPIGIEDFQRQEKTISQAMEKTSIIKKSTTQKVSTPAEVPAPAGTDTGKENVFSRKQSMSQSKTMGEGIKIDYTLAFVKWIGDHHPFIKDEIRNDPINVLKYLAACDLLMEAYRKGKIESFIEKFVLSRNATLQNVKFIDKDRIKNIADTEKSIILTKFLEISTLWNIPDKEKRINSALVKSAIYEINEEVLQDVSNAYLERIEHIKKMKEPISVLQLYTQNKDYAFIKWLAESKPTIVPYITDLDERYIVFSSNSFYLYPETKEIIPQLIEEFEKAIENKDESVTKVVYSKFEPIKEKLADVADTIGNKKSFLFILIPVIAIIVFVKNKKKKQRKEDNTMKTLTCIILAFLFLLPLPIMAETQQQSQQQQQIPIDKLVMPNFVYDHCHLITPSLKVIELNESFINEIGSEVAPKSCKGQVCWSWQTWKAGADFFTWQLYDSTLPLKISNIEKISKSISQTIKQTESLRKSSSNLIDATQEFLKSSFSTGKEKGITRERTITGQKSQEQASELNITPMFHKYLAMALQGPYPAAYPLCISSAVDLFYKAYDSDRVNDLVEVFVIYKTVKPEDIEFSQQKTMLNRAKFLFSLYGDLIKGENEKKYAWAQATLFAKLLEWPEFAQVKTTVDEYIDKVYNTYTMMKTKTTKELAEKDKLLAAIKLLTDKYNTKNNPNPESSAVEDEYVNAAVYYYGQKSPKETENLIQELDKAMQQNDQILTVKLINPKPITQKIPKFAFFIIPAVVIGAIGVILYIKKKHKTQQ
jgi:hypothetical protein